MPTQKWYIGSRTAKDSHPNDGYVCSSATVKPMVIENRSEWVREILLIGNPIYVRDAEREFLKLLNAAADKMSFNKHNGDGRFMTGKQHSQLTKEKLSKHFTGKKRSDETKKKMSESKKGKNNSFFGKSHSFETRKKLSAANIGKTVPDEVRKKISNASKGRIVREDVKEKISSGVKSLPKVSCIYCRREFLPMQFWRFHGEKCKRKLT